MDVPESREREMLRQSLRRFLDREFPRAQVRRWAQEGSYLFVCEAGSFICLVQLSLLSDSSRLPCAGRRVYHW